MNAVPAFRDRFLAYGSRATSTPESEKNNAAAPQAGRHSRTGQENGTVSSLLDYASTFTVPHSFFAHFYILSVLSSLFWGHQILTNGYFFRLLGSWMDARAYPRMVREQVVVAWALMLIQGSRRLYETMMFRTGSKSQMWFAHWVLGLAFYSAMGISVWVEGIRNASPSSPNFGNFDTRGMIAPCCVFFAASVSQHMAHRHLYSLRTTASKSAYSMPTHPLFRYTLTPHYLAECLIYLSLCLIAAPNGRVVNRTIFCGLIFVVVNLGVTADGTRSWYRAEFGAGEVEGKARMIPGLW